VLPAFISRNWYLQMEKNREKHMFNPTTQFLNYNKVRLNSPKAKEYATMVNDQSKNLMTIRGLFEFNNLDPISIDEVEPWTEIVKNLKLVPCLWFAQWEAHENLAIATE
jgi:glutamate synthase (ferredoxin)